MPRRPPKNKILPGQPGNPGRPHGATAKIRVSDKVREAFEQLLAGAAPHLEDWLIRTAQKHPDKALDLWVKISERFVPTLSRQELTGVDGKPLVPIQINMPQIHLPGNMIGEASPLAGTSLVTLPGGEHKELPASEPLLETGGGAPAESPQELFEPPVEAPQQEILFMPDLGKVSAPPGWTRE